MMVDRSETKIFKRQGAKALQGRIDRCLPAGDGGQEGFEMLNVHTGILVACVLISHLKLLC